VSPNASLLSLEKLLNVRVSAFMGTGTTPLPPQLVWSEGSDRGRWNECERTMEDSRELESPCGFLVPSRNRPGDQSKSDRVRPSDIADRTSEVSPIEGNEVRREES